MQAVCVATDVVVFFSGATSAVQFQIEREMRMISNEEKFQAYAGLKTRLKKALASGFWLEACMIEYAIIEDRTASILLHGGITDKGWEKKLSNKLNSIENQIGKEHPIISKKVSVETVREIRQWKELRNEAVHRACITVYDESTFRTIAERGKVLMDRISNDAQKVARADRRGGKET